MVDPFFKDLDQLDQDALASELDQCEHILRLRDSEGWKVLRARLDVIKSEHLTALLSTPAVPENVGEIALSQSKVNACQMIFDEVEAFVNRRKEILALRNQE